MSGILFDGRWVRPGMTGVGIVAFNMLAAVAKQGIHAGVILNEGPVPPELATGFTIIRTKVDLAQHPVTELYEQLMIPYLCYRHGFDSFVSFEGRVPAFHFGIRTFSYIHDLSYLNLRGTHSLKYSSFLIFSLAMSRLFASRIIAVSHTTGRELAKKLRLPAGKILVLQNADSGLARVVPMEIPDLPRPYLLSVGLTNPRKNLPLLLQGFSLFRKNRPEFSLVLTGNKTWIETAGAPYPREKTLNLGFVSQEELRYLYQNTAGLVYPSKDEGFGLPLMDAYREKCPVFCSDIPVFREVMGNYASYFNPVDPEDMAAKLAVWKKGTDNAIALNHGYSWDEAASSLLRAAGE
ncbi:MAG: uncharacterized protein JWO30_75 [Fibrobacteres bacterium]|nr:uncharacterized protein [Fibrobacterota bacterium]